jgi:hypothetical protein
VRSLGIDDVEHDMFNLPKENIDDRFKPYPEFFGSDEK